MRTAARVAAVALVLLAMLSGCGSDPPGQPPPSIGTAVDRPIPTAVSSLAFTTSTGAHTSLDALRGKVVVLTDFLTLCGEECPMTSANMNRMARAVAAAGSADKVVFVEVTVDPRRDTPARLAAYRALYPSARNWRLLTTTASNLKAFCAFFGIFYKKIKEGNPPDHDWLTGKPLTYDIAHQDAVVFLDKQGHERFLVLGNANTDGKRPPQTLYKQLNAEGLKNLRDPGPLSWSVPKALRVVSWLLGKNVRVTT